MSELAVRVEGVGKEYRLGGTRERYTTLRDQVNKLATAPLRALRGRGRRPEQEPPFWALKDVSFEVSQGEVVGIIGRNGAGKSTLLKILSRITEPTEGEADIHGRVGSLLEVGTGFHPELTGRENVYLNGAILGMRRSEIMRKFDEIVSFAQVEKFIDTPVKHYSSGMYMRLAFAVAAHLEPEILIVDEVLAVGDAEFQEKCLGKMGDLARGGRTVLFVSHNLHAIKSLCSQGILLRAGRVFFEGPASECVSKYLEMARAGAGPVDPSSPVTRAGTGEWRFTEVVATKPIFDSSEPKEFRFEVSPTRADAGPMYLSGVLINEDGVILTRLDSRLTEFRPPGPRTVRGWLRIDGLWLLPGRYTLELHVCSMIGVIDLFERAVEFEISPVLPYPRTALPNSTASALVLADFAWGLEP
jgi:lipopolysaccharide transport system ATP-binding protein